MISRSGSKAWRSESLPPTGYLSATGVEACLQYLASTYPSLCQLIVLPETSVEGRTIRAVKIASGGGTRHGVLFIGGVHARELVNPDLLVSLALKLCQAYTAGTGLTFGGKTYSASTVKFVVESLDIFILPLVNPDGRAYVQSPTGDPWWRKNRNPNPSQPCKGVDINRNYDFLWSSGIGTSTYSCSQVFRGGGAFSEPETRNVRWMMDTYPNIVCMADVHSYSELLLHPWGDDDNQTTNPSMNFMNPAYNGLRGSPGDTAYKEYIPQADLDWHVATGTKVKDAIAAVRGRTYTLEQGVLLYPTSGTSEDYAYARHFVDAKKRRVYAFVFETGREFQPVYSEALNIIAEGSSGLLQFCLSCICVAETAVRGTALEAELDELRAFRDEMLTSAAGRKYVRLLDEHAIELLEIAERDERLRRRALGILQRVHEVVKSRRDPKPKLFDAKLVEDVDSLLAKVRGKASPPLKKAIDIVRRDLKRFRGKTVGNALKALS